MEQRSDAGSTPQQDQPRFNPFSDPWPADYTNEDFEADALRVLVSLVRSGKFGPEVFNSPEAYREFCSKHDILTEAERMEAAAEVIREQFPDATEDTVEWGGWPA